jgi:hypothetical protein
VGAGRFTSQPPYNTHVNHLLQSGLEAVEIIQVGNGRAVAGLPGLPEGSEGRSPVCPEGVDPRAIPSYINIIGEDYQVPNTWKASASYQRDLGSVTLGVSGFYTRTTNNFQYYDVNRVAEPFFRIEGGRGVYVPAPRRSRRTPGGRT